MKDIFRVIEDHEIINGTAHINGEEDTESSAALPRRSWTTMVALRFFDDATTSPRQRAFAPKGIRSLRSQQPLGTQLSPGLHTYFQRVAVDIFVMEGVVRWPISTMSKGNRGS